MGSHSQACCTIPPVISKGYEGKGSYVTINGLKTYVTGPANASHAILLVYDIFGFYPQTLQGADILAHGDHTRPYRVFIPDFFEGSPADLAWYPPDNDDKREKMGQFFKNVAAPPKNLPKLHDIMGVLKKDYPTVTKWGGVGFCWGGKMLSLSGGKDTPFNAIAECHPAMVDPEDGGKLTIPVLVLASKDEDATAIKSFQEKLTVKHHVETFGDQVHGWMTARGKLEDEKVKKEYERGYKTVLEFFHEHL